MLQLSSEEHSDHIGNWESGVNALAGRGLGVEGCQWSIVEITEDDSFAPYMFGKSHVSWEEVEVEKLYSIAMQVNPPSDTDVETLVCTPTFLR